MLLSLVFIMRGSIIKEILYDFNAFKSFMLDRNIQGNYVIHYCSNLDEKQWAWFHSQVLRTSFLIHDLDFMFYCFKWILKNPFSDLRYEVYTFYMTDNCINTDNVYSDNQINYLNLIYYQRFLEDFSEY